VYLRLDDVQKRLFLRCFGKLGSTFTGVAVPTLRLLPPLSPSSPELPVEQLHYRVRLNRDWFAAPAIEGFIVFFRTQ
jgi:hypothetical protein